MKNLLFLFTVLAVMPASAQNEGVKPSPAPAPAPASAGKRDIYADGYWKKEKGKAMDGITWIQVAPGVWGTVPSNSPVASKIDEFGTPLPDKTVAHLPLTPAEYVAFKAEVDASVVEIVPTGDDGKPAVTPTPKEGTDKKMEYFDGQTVFSGKNGWTCVPTVAVLHIPDAYKEWVTTPKIEEAREVRLDFHNWPGTLKNDIQEVAVTGTILTGFTIKSSVLEGAKGNGKIVVAMNEGSPVSIMVEIKD